jgi:hypothetical protein
MKRFKTFIIESNPHHLASNGRFYDPKDKPADGSWSLYYSEPEKGRQRLKKGSKKKRYSLPNEVINKCGRSGKYKCSTGKKSDSKTKDSN